MTHQTRALSLLLCICLLISFTLCLFSCSGDPIKHICAISDAELSIESEFGVGTTVTVVFSK